MLDAERSGNMSGGIYITGWLLLAMGFRLWPLLFFGPLGIISGVYTLIGAVWTYDTLKRGKVPARTIVGLMVGVPILTFVIIWLMPLKPVLQ